MRLPVACLARTAVLMAFLPLGLARAETTPAKCPALEVLVQEFTGYAVRAESQAAVLGWCVMDRAVMVADRPDWPDLKVATLRFKGEVEGNVVVAIEVDIAGLRLVAGLGSKQVDEELQRMFRLQNADLWFRAEVNAEAGRLEVRGFALVLSGGTEISLSADLSGAGLSPLGVAAGRLTGLELQWNADGRLMRGVMEAAGVGIDGSLAGAEAITAARDGLQGVIEVLPGSLVDKDSRHELDGMTASLPEGRGVLQLSFRSDEGIGAADLLVAGLGKAPLEETLATLFAGSSLQADWSQGLQH